jgi:tRNA A-37 threonylcarbamoyl transferase component Bud32
MDILCPHCRNPIDIVRLTPREEITCPSCGSSFCLETESTTGLESGTSQKVGRFEVLDVLGRGAFGTVYKARDPELDRVVAVKVPRAGNLAGSHDLDRFLREARSVAQLRHWSIVSVHEVGLSKGLPYLVSDFVQGVTLADLLGTRRPAPDDAARLLADVAEALHYAHEQGIIHRDVKPSNIMLDAENRPHVMDFGLAKRDAGEITMTIEGQVLGTPAYMSPEQARGEGHTVDGRSDVYSLGVVLYQMLTGELPFRGTKRVLLHQVLHDEPRPPRRLNDRIPRDLETICLEAMAKEPGRRYATAGEMAADLRRYLKREPIQARPVGRLERGWRWCRRNPALAAALAGVLLVFAAGATVSTVLAIGESHARGNADREADNARTKEIAAVAAKNDLQKANTELTRSQQDLRESHEQLLTTAAQGLLGPLAGRVKPNLPLPPLGDPEIQALWALAGTAEEKLRARFVEEAIRTPVTTWQLRCRAGFALQAAVGLDARRRQTVEGLLRERLSAPGLAEEQRVDLALSLAALGDLRPQTAKEVAALLTQATARTIDPFALGDLARGLAAVAARLEPRDAATQLAQTLAKTTDYSAQEHLARGLAAVAARLKPQEAEEAAAQLAQAMAMTTNASVQRELARGLAAVAARLGPKETAAVCAPAAAQLAQVLARTTNASVKRELARGLAEVAARLGPKEAAAVCAPAAAQLTQALTQTTDAQARGELARGLAAVAARLEPQDAAALAAQLAQALAQTTSPAALGSLAQALAAVAARLGRKEEAAVCTPAAAQLTRALAQTTDAQALGELVPGLAAVAAWLEPQAAAGMAAQLAQALAHTTSPAALGSLAQGLGAVAARLEPREAAAVCAPAAAQLAQTAGRFGPVSRGLGAVAAWLEPQEAAALAAQLTQTMAQTTSPFALGDLARGLAAVAARLEPQEAAAVCTPAAAQLAQALAQTNVVALRLLAPSLAAVAARLEPQAAAAVAAQLAQAVAQKTDPFSLGSIAQGLAAASARLEPKKAAAVCAPAAAQLTQALAKADAAVQRELALGLAAVLAQEPTHHRRQRTTSPAGAVGLALAPAALPLTVAHLAPALEPSAEPLPTPLLVELLKHPLCVGEARRAVLDVLAERYHRPFADQWEFVRFAEEQKLGLDFTSPPKRPTTPSGDAGR